ncbi:hypothetical protein [Pyxidicoccus trucidator]|uniref:hypothetical protein n=1 Tax=Pyxidicoccus trucidator TaxID=2709662 RepID=UPI0013D9F406|nr:hypothetical protein [Pyxidicoccus trucidator]
MKRAHLSALTLASVLFAGEVLAVVGRPLTPVSVAGVARRTTRRTVYAGAAVGAAAVGTAAVVGTTAAVMSTLPAGCVNVVQGGVTYHQCGGTYYRPSYQGTNLVYVPTSM